MFGLFLMQDFPISLNLQSCWHYKANQVRTHRGELQVVCPLPLVPVIFVLHLIFSLGSRQRTAIVNHKTKIDNRSLSMFCPDLVMIYDPGILGSWELYYGDTSWLFMISVRLYQMQGPQDQTPHTTHALDKWFCKPLLIQSPPLHSCECWYRWYI